MFLNKIRFLLFISGSFLIFSTGCSSPFKQTNVSSNEFYRADIVNTLNINRIGFLTTAVSRGSSLAQYRIAVSDIMEKAFRNEKQAINIISSREAINNINTADLTDSYAKMLDYYDTTGILNKNYLKKIGDALGIQYIIQPRLLTFTEITSIRLSALGLALISTRETTVKISLQLWDTMTGNIVWEGSGQATIAVEAMRATPVTFEEVVETASISIVKKLPF